jgi:hypothetical protein
VRRRRGWPVNRYINVEKEMSRRCKTMPEMKLPLKITSAAQKNSIA